MLRILSVRVFFLFFLLALPAGAAAASFGGVGIDGVPLEDGRIRVGQLVKGGPAHSAGIRTGDVITSIDGKSVAGENFRLLVSGRLRGRAGTPVQITVQRGAGKELLTFKLVRRQMLHEP